MAKTGQSEKEYRVWASSIGKRVHISSLDKTICRQTGVNSIADLITKRTESTYHHVLSNSANPYEIAVLWQDAKADLLTWHCKLSAIANGLRRFPKANLESHCDKKYLDSVSKKWFDQKGTHIDVQAMNMTESSGYEIDMQDIIDFVKSYAPGQYKNAIEIVMIDIEARWKELTGFVIKDYYVQHLLSFEQPSVAEPEARPFKAKKPQKSAIVLNETPVEIINLPTEPVKIRKIKISKKARVHGFSRQVKYVPSLNLCGVWLQNMGFGAGNTVNVQYINDQIVVSHG